MPIAELARLAIVALASALFSAIIAHRSHQQKRWWELRVAAYQELIYALSDVVHYYARHYQAAIERRDLPDESAKRLDEAWESGYPKIRRAADAGAFLFSDDVNKAMLNLVKVSDTRQDTYEEHLDCNLHAARECLKAVVTASKVDLKLRWWWV